jgi:glucose/arabinose dehydrogenase
LDHPEDAIELSDGTLIVAEPARGRLMHVGTKSTPLVEGLEGPVGLLDARDGTVYVAEGPKGRIVQVSIKGGAVKPVADRLGSVRAMAMGAKGNLLALDVTGGRLLSVGMAGGKVDVLATNLPVGYLTKPYPRSGGIAVGADGSIYVAADVENAIYRLRRCRSKHSCS